MLMKRFRIALIPLLLLSMHAARATSPEEFLDNPPPKNQPAQPSATPAAAPSGASAPAAKKAAPQPAVAPAAKSAVSKEAPPLDTAKIHMVYLDGDFDQAMKSLEIQLKSKRPMTHAESVFVYKHLGVMYAANATTREKGKYFMYQLINIEPTAKILDMYASDMIHLIYRNVQEDYEMKRSKTARLYDPAPAAPAPDTVKAAPAPAPVAAARPQSRSRTAYWVAGGAVAVVGVAGLLYIVLHDPQPKTQTINVPE
jgi:hypothetical protein